MKAVVLVGGEGTRMRPLTESVPKPLLPFMNGPFLGFLLDRLAGFDIDTVILSSPYLEETFRPFLDERRRSAPDLVWVTEERPLGTSGAIAGARDHLDETFVACNGDVLTDLDIAALIAAHRDRNAEATIALTPVEDARPFGLVEVDDDGRVKAFREKPAELVPGLINAGTYVLEPGLLDGVPPDAAVSIERETFPAAIDEGRRVFGVPWRGYWRDIGTPAAYLAAHLDALEGLVAGSFPRPLLGDGVTVDPGASVGARVVLGAGASVGPRAIVERSVLHADSRVDEGATVEDSILGMGAIVGADAVVRGSVLGSGAEVPAKHILEDVKLSGGSG